jgi:hypothetical protein
MRVPCRAQSGFQRTTRTGALTGSPETSSMRFSRAPLRRMPITGLFRLGGKLDHRDVVAAEPDTAASTRKRQQLALEGARPRQPERHGSARARNDQHALLICTAEFCRCPRISQAQAFDLETPLGLARVEVDEREPQRGPQLDTPRLSGRDADSKCGAGEWVRDRRARQARRREARPTRLIGHPLGLSPGFGERAEGIRRVVLPRSRRHDAPAHADSAGSRTVGPHRLNGRDACGFELDLHATFLEGELGRHFALNVAGAENTQGARRRMLVVQIEVPRPSVAEHHRPAVRHDASHDRQPRLRVEDAPHSVGVTTHIGGEFLVLRRLRPSSWHRVNHGHAVGGFPCAFGPECRRDFEFVPAQQEDGSHDDQKRPEEQEFPSIPWLGEVRHELKSGPATRPVDSRPRTRRARAGSPRVTIAAAFVEHP